MAFSTVPSWYEPLNQRESQILGLISEGNTNREIAQKLSLSMDTIKWYNKQLFSKLGVSSRTQASAVARKHGLLETEESSPVEAQPLPKHNLPHIPTSFIGRQRKIAEIKQLVQTTRLVVLTGPGGSGKTRLAIQVAAEIIEQFPDGAWLVELAPISDPDLVLTAVADVLGISQQGEASLLSKIKHNLGKKRLLLVLDNFEHLLSASSLVGDLIESAPQITILATSREKLHVYGEQEYPVQPLALPDLKHAIPDEELLRYESVSLFIDRARAVRQDFSIQPGETAALAQLCNQLDGLPLALELAASWVKMFSLATLSERLGNRLSFLTGGAHNLPERQRTLRDTIDWSYNLLGRDERMLFVRLAIFRGGGALEAIERICGQEIPSDLLLMLSSLVDKSLVQVREGVDGEMRFGMLETIREYGLERLTEAGDADQLNRLHAGYYASMVEKAAGELRSRNQRYWFERLHSEYDNLRAALAWSLNSPDPEAGLRITAGLRDYWYYSGLQDEFQHWSEIALERIQNASPGLQAGVLLCIGQMGIMLKDKQKGIDLLRQAASFYSQLCDERNVAWSEMFLGALLSNQSASKDKGDALCLKSLATFRQIGDLPGQAQALNILGEDSRLRLELESAQQYYQQCLEVVAQTGESLREGMMHVNLGFIAYRQGDYLKAFQLMKYFIQIMEEFRNDYGLMTAIAAISGPLAALGYPERAAKLLAASEAQMEVMGSRHQSTDLPEIEEYKRMILATIGEPAFQAARAASSHMTIEELVALARHELD